MSGSSSPLVSNGVGYIDRERGEMVEEVVFGEDILHFLYQNRVGCWLRSVLGRRAFVSHVYGRLKGRRGASAIRDFVEHLGIDASEAEKPLHAYRNLDEFFVRRLKPGVRSIDTEPSHLVSPGDGRLMVVQLQGPKSLLRVKASEISLAELMGYGDESSRYVGGVALILRLAPADYHRFHFPASGFASSFRELPGPLESVHPIALSAGAKSFANKRMLSTLETSRFGNIVMIEVGALAVGTIVMTYEPGRVEVGEEKGYFRFGGSTVVLLFEPNKITVDNDLISNSSRGLETYLKLGTRIARAR